MLSQVILIVYQFSNCNSIVLIIFQNSHIFFSLLYTQIVTLDSHQYLSKQNAHGTIVIFRKTTTSVEEFYEHLKIWIHSLFKLDV